MYVVVYVVVCAWAAPDFGMPFCLALPYLPFPFGISIPFLQSIQSNCTREKEEITSAGN